MLWTRSLLVAALVGAATRDALAEDRCTAILVGAKASTTNAPMTTHTNDCSSCDFRIVKVPARKHAPGAVHEVVLAGFDYPRYVGSARGSEYLPENLDKRFFNWTATPAIGTIPQVNETFAYIDGAYGIINEHQVAIGESTCGARFISKPRTQGGDALFDVSELSRIALQRAKTAREAIQIMGDLGVKHGYYGAEWEGEGVYAEAGEALTVTDTAEAWMFHILPDDAGKSAIWAAQRVPDDHISAVANQFVIHEIDVNKTDEFMASANIYEVALRNDIWNQSEPFDFTKVYSKARDEGHQYYSTRRVWRLFTLADPTLDLSPETDVFSSDYPFSVKPAQKLSPHDIMRFQRDHYEGTAFDMTEGPSGGPYGDPDRYDGGVNGNMTEKDVTSGTFERAISIFRASYSFVSILDPANADNAYIWFGQYAPHATSYAPVYTKVDTIPAQYTKGSLLAFDRESSFWVHALVGNWVARFYKFAHPFVSEVQLDLEALVGSMQPDLLQQAALVKKSGGEAAMVDFLTEQSALFASQSHKTFTELFEYIVTVFHDGYQMSGFYSGHLTATPLFYPKWWLQQVGYYGDAKNATAAKDEDDDKDTIVFPPVVALVPTVAPATVLPPVTKEPTAAPTPAATTAAPTAAPTLAATTAAPTAAPTPAATTAAPTAAPTPAATTAAPVTELPLPLPTVTMEPPATATPSPTPTPEAVEVQVRSSGDDKSTAAASSAHQVSYWATALIALLSMVVGVFIGRNFNGFKKTGYRPIR